MLSDEQNRWTRRCRTTAALTCFGCHAISLDGTKIGLTFGGSQPSLFALINVATKQTIATRLFASDPNPNQPFAAFTAFFAGGNREDAGSAR